MNKNLITLIIVLLIGIIFCHKEIEKKEIPKIKESTNSSILSKILYIAFFPTRMVFGLWKDAFQYAIFKVTVFAKYRFSPVCFTNFRNSTEVCNGHGYCFNGTCFCFDGWKGRYCEYNSTNSTSCLNGTNVCSGHGYCKGNVCYCKFGFYGDKCQFTVYECFSKSSLDPKVCSGNGRCVGKDKCVCKNGYFGENCQNKEIFECFKKTSDDPTVCSSHGRCIFKNICACDVGWAGFDCHYKIENK
jgi:hypothetical protein